MGALRLILGLLLAVAVVSFGVMNMDPVSVTYHRIGTYKVPLFYVLIAFFASGFVVAWVGGDSARSMWPARRERLSWTALKEIDSTAPTISASMNVAGFISPIHITVPTGTDWKWMWKVSTG